MPTASTTVTWAYHLRRHEVSRWFRDFITDDALAAAAEAIEGLVAIGTAIGGATLRR